MPDENKNRMILGFAVIFIIVVAVLGYLLGGLRGIANLFNFLKWVVIGSIILGMIVWGVWFLFIRKIRDDRVALNMQQIVKLAKLTKPSTIRDLYLSGDKEHPQIRLGVITGYTRIKNMKGEEEDVFCWKKAGFPLSMFEDSKAIRLQPEQHSEMIGDIIMKGIALVTHGGFFYVNTDHLDTEMIDQTIKTEVIRKFALDVLSDVKIISDLAVGLDSSHVKGMESRSLLKIPTQQQPIQQNPSYEEMRR